MRLFLSVFATAVLSCPAGAQVINDSFRVFTIHSPPEIARTDTLRGQVIDWGGQPPMEGITGRLVSVRDTGGTDLGCWHPANREELAGQIALIQRGECGFSVKVYYVERAGATAFVIYQDDRVPDDDCSSVWMAGSDTAYSEIPGAFLPRCIAAQVVPVVRSGTEVIATMARLVTVGRDEDPDELSPSLIVSPNPAGDQAVVLLRLRAAGDARISVADLLGRNLAVLHSGPLSAGQHEFPLRLRLRPGSYVVRVRGRHLVRNAIFTIGR